MRIDPTIYAAIDAGTLTSAEALAAMTRMLPEIERVALETVAADAIAAGFCEDDVRRMIERHAQVLCKTRADRIETMRQRLAVGSTHLQ